MNLQDHKDPVNKMFLWILIVCSFTAFFTACGIGANDVANSFATSVGAKVLTLKQAIIIAAIFEFAGAFLMGSHVTDTVRKGIVDTALFEADIYVLMYGMLCASIASGVWLAIATYYRAPVSTTHSTVGAIVGFALVFGGVDAVNWTKIGLIVASWVISPLMSGVLTFGIFAIIKYGALRRDDPVKNALRIFPFMAFLALGINTFFIIYKGTPALGLSNIPLWLGIVIAVAIGLVASGVAFALDKFYLRSKIEDWVIPETSDIESDNGFDFTLEEYNPNAEKLFSYLQIFTACMSSFAHGANDVANSIGPYAAVFGIYVTNVLAEESQVPLWILAIGGVGIVVGLAGWGKGVIERVGKELSKITPTRGFSMELGASLSVVTASRLGIPVSTTHCQVGSVMGGGLAEGRSNNVSWKTFGKIAFSWAITLPITAGISAALFAFGYYSP